MISVITGDIVNSRKSNETWLKKLKRELNKLGKSPHQWEIYRGDSFQVEVKDPAEALRVAITIKAALKSMKDTDARMAIGIGNKKRGGRKITESNGSAFVYSGEKMEELKTLRLSLAVRSGNNKFDNEINLYLKLILIIMDGWNTNAAKTVHTALEHPGSSQQALGKILKIRQNAVSTRLKRACYNQVSEVIEMYKTKITEL